jgi:hypothetical protein
MDPKDTRQRYKKLRHAYPQTIFLRIISEYKSLDKLYSYSVPLSIFQYSGKLHFLLEKFIIMIESLFYILNSILFLIHALNYPQACFFSCFDIASKQLHPPFHLQYRQLRQPNVHTTFLYSFANEQKWLDAVFLHFISSSSSSVAGCLITNLYDVAIRHWDGSWFWGNHGRSGGVGHTILYIYILARSVDSIE